eukprot:CAMPEP_0114313842 /NCGR_PEP_ID=MMETSP0059-20121206/21391_1 /TAXON_ID=36894 /ORGANISM="Pyramimonas parkeae, Strain CCMP726" /LENGTH=287 /DNA_ID=CAMNT_0001438745 /DNA_START=346 /DNA_END=1206 /DNA_ORIENTATION=+
MAGSAAIGARRSSQSLRSLWPLLNLAAIFALLGRRLNRTQTKIEDETLPKCIDLLSAPTQCIDDCNGRGICVDGACVCPLSWGGDSCSVARCAQNCSGHGTCMENGNCMCSREYVGEDCSVEVAELKVANTLERLGVPFTAAGRFDPDVDLMMTSRASKRYGRMLCRTPACVATWESASSQLAPFLPKEDLRPKYPSCAVVSSAQQLVPRSPKEEHLHTPHGAAIDKHSMVLRLDNAPSAGFERWVGSRTTHRLVHGDYANLVHSMLGTEVVVNNTKSVVTPSTWWA